MKRIPFIPKYERPVSERERVETNFKQIVAALCFQEGGDTPDIQRSGTHKVNLRNQLIPIDTVAAAYIMIDYDSSDCAEYQGVIYSLSFSYQNNSQIFSLDLAPDTGFVIHHLDQPEYITFDDPRVYSVINVLNDAFAESRLTPLK